MKLILNVIVSLVLIFIIDALWINGIAGSFYAEQLSEIARFNPDGSWNVRMWPGIAVYLVMAFAIEIFVFRNKSVYGLSSTLWHAAFLGFSIYGVYDFTNRAILESYPIAMVTVDVMWGTALFTAVAFVHFHLRRTIAL